MRRLLQAELLKLDPGQGTRKNQAACHNNDPRLDVESGDVVGGISRCNKRCGRTVNTCFGIPGDAYWRG